MAPGSAIAHYRITAKLGEGGMGEVWRATDTRLNRDVAIKILPDSFSQDTDRLTRFTREAQVLAALNHPNIATVYGVEQGAIIMELVEGQDLRGPVPLETALDYARQIAAALEAAHEKGIVHRDLKPANIKVTPQGQIKLLDFGLAKAAEGPAPSAPDYPTRSPTITLATQAGVILGTAAYMSPEQARGETVDKRADIWSFGVVLYELLSGKRLFDGKTISDTLAAVLMKDPDFEPIPTRFRKLVKACLERDTRRRLRDIGEAWRLLDPEWSGAPSPSQRLRSNRAVWGIALAAILTAAALAVLHFREPKPQQRVLRYTIALPANAGNVREAAVSPDGRYVVLQAGGAPSPLWLRSLDSLETGPLPGTEGAGKPFWSPDSRYLAFFANGQLKKIPISGGSPQTLCEAPSGAGGTWGPQGVIVFSPNQGNGGLKRIADVGGIPASLTKPKNGAHRFPWFLPDGRRFLYLAVAGQDDGIYLGSLDSGQSRLLVPVLSNPEYVRPSPRNALGLLLFERDQTLVAQPVDPETMNPKGDIFRVAETVAGGSTIPASLYSVSDSGVLAYRTDRARYTRRFVWLNRAGEEAGEAAGAVMSTYVSLSPEGQRAVIDRPSDRGSDLWLMDLHTSQQTRFTFDPSYNFDPVWSADGSQIAFASDRAAAGLYRRASSNVGQDELLFREASARPWDRSRDGRFIVFHRFGEKTSDDIWALPLTGEAKPILLVASPGRDLAAQVSPNGRWLAYSTNTSGRFEIEVQPFTPAWDKPLAGKWQVSPAGGIQPRWRADGKELYYIATDRRLMAVEINESGNAFGHAAPKPLFQAQSTNNVQAFGYAPSTDGQRFLMSVPPRPEGDGATLTVVVNWQDIVKR